MLVAAGPGYGKTTLLAQWAAREDRPVAWVSLDPADDDPAVLTEDIVRSLGHVQPGPAPSSLWTALTRMCGPFTLVLDDVHLLREPATLELLRSLAACLAPGSQLAIATRAELALPIANWSLHREVVRIGAEDLAMTHAEARALLRAAGVEVAARDLETLVGRTEGWPAGLSLAAVALQEQGGPAPAAQSFAGDDRLVAGYFREQLLALLPPDLAGFLTRASVLESLSPEACDAVLQRTDSGRMLAQLERAHAFVIPLDRSQHRYRQHRLLREMLAAELRRQAPEVELDLQARASVWHEANDQPELAIRHACAARQVRRISHVVSAALPRLYGRGHLEILGSSLGELSDAQIAAHPSLATAMAWCCLDAGDTPAAEFYAGAGERGSNRSTSSQAALRAVLAAQGVTRMGEDAARGRVAGAAGDGWRDVCCLLEGIAWRLRGEGERARPRLQEAARLAAGRRAPAVLAPSLAQLALLTLAPGDIAGATSLAAWARDVVAAEGVSNRTTLVQVHAAAAYAFARRGQIDEARIAIEEATQLLASPGFELSWLGADARLALANASLLTGDASRARALIREAALLLDNMPDPGLLPEGLAACRQRADDFRMVGLLGPSALSRAEVRILQLLPTHLTYHEIGVQLQRSPYTVKTQALAAFRKLDVSSRSEAVERARALGLIPG